MVGDLIAAQRDIIHHAAAQLIWFLTLQQVPPYDQHSGRTRRIELVAGEGYGIQLAFDSPVIGQRQGRVGAGLGGVDDDPGIVGMRQRGNVMNWIDNTGDVTGGG